MSFKKYFFLFLLYSGSSVCSAQTGRSVDILHYSYSIQLNDQNDSINGMAEISFITLDTVSIISFDLAVVNKENKGMTVQDVWINAAPKLFNYGTLSFSHNDNKLLIKLSSTLPKNQKTVIGINYRGIPSDGLIISKNKFGRRTFFSDNWPDRAHNWIPCVDDPADKASVEFSVHAPAHYNVISNGTLLKDTVLSNNTRMTHWKEEIPLPTKIIALGVADFAIKQLDTINNIPVSAWAFPENKEEAFFDYAPAVPALAFLSDYIGPFPYKKLANVQSKTIFGGMENASAIFYNQDYVNGKQDRHTIIAHEIAHQWFGDMVTEKSFTHLWLSEGFATYLAMLYMEKKFGADTGRYMRDEDRQKIIDFTRTSDRPVVDSLSSYMELLNANSYEKGGWALHMLRLKLGDVVFQKCIRAYYAAYAGKNADTRDLQQVFEKVAGKDLSVFFRQWLYTPGIPKLEIKWKYVAKNNKIIVTVQQLQKDLFQFPLELLLQTSTGKPQNQTVQVNQALHSFSIPARKKPVVIKADPGINLLFEGNIAEIK